MSRPAFAVTGMFNHRKISVVLPCLNEERGLACVLGWMPAFVDEVIVVDNGSDDNSKQVAKRYNARLLTEETKGYGHAIMKGLKAAQGDIIAIIDADASYHPQILEKICGYMEQGNFDFISGCRFPLTIPKAMPLINKYSNYFISCLIRFLFRINIIDSQSGMMLFKNVLLKRIELTNGGMGFTQEIKIKACLAAEINYGEFHISYAPRLGKSKFRRLRDSLKDLYDVLLLWRQLGGNSI